jgi:succinate dehydrogenase / fumarate reductase, cytochrome b subunit
VRAPTANIATPRFVLRLLYQPPAGTRSTGEPQQCDDSVNKKRPVNLDIGTIDLPVTAYVSITHRATGVALFVGVGILMWLLDLSLSSEDGFNQVKALFDSFFCKLVIWGVLAALIYHTVAGVRHLIMDLGIGESMEGGVRGARTVIVVSILLTVLVGALIW